MCIIIIYLLLYFNIFYFIFIIRFSNYLLFTFAIIAFSICDSSNISITIIRLFWSTNLLKMLLLLIVEKEHVEDRTSKSIYFLLLLYIQL